MREKVEWVTTGLVLALGVLGLWGGSQLATLTSRIESLFITPRPEFDMQTLTETVTLSDGRKITVTTTRGSDETVADFIARHNAVVAALQGE